ncbi:HdeA/HdeB family chaperone [Budvicia aquatica]|uniref:Acid stress chaperone HdeB n=1 Tax=Budvicia aquatica TaxID=82979 RepID=A0A2C6DFV4_9GAMM|nr:HdeA/HdeB family chaperone [Budvicia aquatica]PHI28087.1 acid-resistance protein [Budvicia aquatica]GKX50884.1 acid-resistance protein [Budvicia aquatica]VFS45865.1 10K-L protein [Budvicia aquatica]
MLYKSIRNMAMAGILLAVAGTSFAATTPDGMTCKQFINLDPQAATPVAFWVLNSYSEYKGGDYVALNEVDTMLTPQLIKLCKENPDKKLTDMKQDILNLSKKK